MLGQPPGPFATLVGQLVLIIVHRRRAAMNDPLLLLHLPQQFLEQQKRQLDLVGNIASADVAAGQEEFERQLFDFAFGQLGFGERGGSAGKNSLATGAASDGGRRCWRWAGMANFAADGGGIDGGGRAAGQLGDATQELIELVLSKFLGLLDGGHLRRRVVGQSRGDGGIRVRSLVGSPTGQSRQQIIDRIVGHGLFNW